MANKSKQTVYEVFLTGGLKLPDGNNSKIVFTYADAIKLKNSNKKRGKRIKGSNRRGKTTYLFDKIVPTSMADVQNRFNARMQEFIEKTKLEEEDKIAICRYGKRTQHIFKNGNYMLTIDWSKV